MEYHFKPVAKACAATGTRLVPGATCISALVEQNGELTRLDYSESAWSGPPAGTVGHWRCVVPEPTEHKSKPLDTEALMRYFEQLGEDANPVQEKFAYVVALLLLQKRRLRIDGSRQDGDIEYLQFIGSHGEGPFEIRDQNLTAEEIEELQRELNGHLASEWS